MNFTLGNHEIWGPSARNDLLVDYFEHLLNDCRLIDIAPEKLKPTWTNKRTGQRRISKRLDRFLLAEHLLEQNYNFRQWVDLGGVSDHSPICLEIFGDSTKPPGPFKLCASWLKEEEVSKIIKDTWSPFCPEEGNYTTLDTLLKISLG